MRKLHQFVCLNVIKRWKACHNKLLNRHCHLLKETPEVTGGSVHFLLSDKGSVLLSGVSGCQVVLGCARTVEHSQRAGVALWLLLLLGFAASGVHLHFQLLKEWLQVVTGGVIPQEWEQEFIGVKFWLWSFLWDTAQLCSLALVKEQVVVLSFGVCLQELAITMSFCVLYSDLCLVLNICISTDQHKI